MKYEFNGKNLTIPDRELEKSMKLFNISKDEAIQLWLDDNDYTTNEVVEELSDKAKKNVKLYGKSDKKRKPSTRERKVDTEKAYLLNILINAIKNEDCIDSVKNEAEFAFSHGENAYTVKLIKHRAKKAGVV